MGNPRGESHDVAAHLPEPPARVTGPERDFVPCASMEGFLRVHPDVLSGEAPPEAVAEVTAMLEILTRERYPDDGIVLPQSVWAEWEPLNSPTYPAPRTDRAPHGTRILTTLILGALLWLAAFALGYTLVFLTALIGG